MVRLFSRFLVAALLLVSAAGLTAVSFDAAAARVGSGKSVGSQSSNVTSKAPAASSTMQKARQPLPPQAQPLVLQPPNQAPPSG